MWRFLLPPSLVFRCLLKRLSNHKQIGMAPFLRHGGFVSLWRSWEVLGSEPAGQLIAMQLLWLTNKAQSSPKLAFPAGYGTVTAPGMPAFKMMSVSSVQKENFCPSKLLKEIQSICLVLTCANVFPA